MKIISIISEWAKKPKSASQQSHGFVPSYKKMVEAIVEINGCRMTKHIQTNK